MTKLCVIKRFTATLLLAATYSGLVACESAYEQTPQLAESELLGSWYGVYSQGRDTVLFEAELQPDGQAQLLYRLCFANEEIEKTEEHSRWSLDLNTLSFSFPGSVSKFGDKNAYVHSYKIIESVDDYVRYTSASNGRKFWMERKWSDESYTCATTKNEITRHRRTAFAAGNATSELFLGEEKPVKSVTADEKAGSKKFGEMKP